MTAEGRREATSEALRDWLNETIGEAVRRRDITLDELTSELRLRLGRFDLRRARGFDRRRGNRGVPLEAVRVIARMCRGDLDRGIALWHRAASFDSESDSVPRPTRTLHGRDDEMKRCMSALQRAQVEQRAVTLLLTGDQGMGKTELARHLAHKASGEGFVVTWAADRPDIASLEMALGIEFDFGGARLSLGNTALLALTEVRVARLADELARRAGRQPVLVIAENLHDAYPSTRATLVALARLRVPLVLLCTSRPEPYTGRVATDIEAIADDACMVGVGPLSPAAVAAMVDEVAYALAAEDRAEVASELLHLSQGHPFRASKLLDMHFGPDGDWRPQSALQALREDGKLTAIDLEVQRIRRLPPATVAALQVAAVLGRTFDVTLLRRVVHGSPDDRLGSVLQAGINQHLIAQDATSTRFHFAHDFVREAVLQLTPELLQQDIHRQLANILRSPVGYRSVVDPLAHAFATLHHLSEARRLDEDLTLSVVAWALWAAHHAMDGLDMRLATDAIQTGLTALPPDATPYGAARSSLREVLAELGTGAARAMALKRAFRLLEGREGDNVTLFADLAAQVTFSSVFGTPDAEITSMCQQALAQIPVDRRGLRARVLGAMSYHLCWTGQSRSDDGTSVDALSEEALRLALTTDDARAVNIARMARNAVLLTSPRLDEAVLNACAIGHAESAVTAEVLVTHLRRGDRAAFDTDLREFRQNRYAPNPLWHRGMCAQFDACEAFMNGEFDDAHRCLDALEAIVTETGDENFALLHMAGTLWYGYEVGSVPALRESLDASIEPGCALPGLVASLAMFHASPGGDPGRARDILGTLLGRGLAATNRDITWTVVLALLAETIAFLGDETWANDVHQALLPYSNQVIVLATGLFCIGAVDRFLGMLAPLTGRHTLKDAACWFDRAESLEEALGAPALTSRTRYWHGRILARHGRSADARMIMEEALEDSPASLTNVRAWARAELRRLRH